MQIFARFPDMRSITSISSTSRTATRVSQFRITTLMQIRLAGRASNDLPERHSGSLDETDEPITSEGYLRAPSYGAVRLGKASNATIESALKSACEIIGATALRVE